MTKPMKICQKSQCNINQSQTAVLNICKFHIKTTRLSMSPSVADAISERGGDFLSLNDQDWLN